MSGPNVGEAVAVLLPRLSRVLDVTPIGGGCISDAHRVRAEFAAGPPQTLFVKSNHASFGENFQAEFDGLRRLAATDVIGVPQPLAEGIVANRAWLATEWIEPGSANKEFFANFGRSLAALHRPTLGTSIGLARDNFLGAAHQLNAATNNWIEFFVERRIGYQLRWAVDQGLADTSLRRDCEAMIASMDKLLAGREEKTSLLHGDLWSGNYLCDVRGAAYMIDPAVYHGCREAEFGMLRLFGGCPDAFYAAYHDAFPLADGWQRRVSVYVLYHLLNHLNLFGSSYLTQCGALAAEVLRQ